MKILPNHFYLSLLKLYTRSLNYYMHNNSKTIYLASLIILLFCFLATIILNLSKSVVLALLVFASIFFAHAVLFQDSNVFCSSQALIRFFCVAFLGNLLTTISVSERRFKPIGWRWIPVSFCGPSISTLFWSIISITVANLPASGP